MSKDEGSLPRKTHERQEEDGETGPIWYKEDENWELTWPIWHMLPWGERKALAKEHGYNTIGEFEEYMTLRRAVGESDYPILPAPYDPALVYAHLEEAKKVEVDEHHESEDDQEDELFTQSQQEPCSSSSSCSRDHQVTDEELLEQGGHLLALPEELLHFIFSWIPVDNYASVALVSPHWKYITRTEYVYKRLCERCYLQTSKRKQLKVSKFGSYRNMLYSRPRVRSFGGLYVLKFAQVKQIQRDMWTEVPIGAILETVYYRYLYFMEDGRVIYALTTSSPHEMIPRIVKVYTKNEVDRIAVWGAYQVQKDKVTVIAKQEWQTVKLELTIQEASISGRFGALSFTRHFSSSSGNFDEYYSQDLTEYKVPHEPFRYLKDRRL
jgi:F-box protein 9